MSVKETQDEDKMRRFKGECAQFNFNRCPIYAHDGASAKLSTNSQETDNIDGEEHAEGGSMPRESSMLREPVCYRGGAAYQGST